MQISQTLGYTSHTQFLCELTPIALRNPYKFKKILAILAERETDAITANLLYNAFAYNKITFQIFSQSLLENGMSEKQLFQIKSQMLYALQDDSTSLREYVNGQIKLLQLFGGKNEYHAIKNIMQAVHPKY